MAAPLKSADDRLQWRDHAAAIGLFTLLTAWYLWPYLLRPMGFNGIGDDGLFANALWWFKRCLVEGKNPFFSPVLFYPEGMNLVFHTTTYSNFLLTLPVNLVWGVEAAVNASYFLGFIISGYCTYLLVHDLTGSRSGALVAGIIYAFAPFHFSHGRGHLHVSTLQWLPCYFFLLRRALAKGTVRLALAAGISFGVLILTDQLQTICAALVTAGCVGAAALHARTDRHQLRTGCRQLILIGLAAAASASFYLLPLVRELMRHNVSTKVPPLEHGGANMFSADLLGFVLPGFHRLWGGAFSSFNLGRDSVVYIGLVVLGLAVYGGWQRRRERIVRWTIVVALCFWVLSLGTYLHVNGTWEFSFGRIPLPYLAMTDIPMLGENRTPCRFHMVTLLALAILAGFGIKTLQDSPRWSRSLGSRIGVVILAALILLETIPPRDEPGSMQVPAIYRQIARDPRPVSVLQMPLSRWSALLKNGSGSPMMMMYYQTIHEKPIFGGLASRLPPEDLAFDSAILGVLADIAVYDNQLIRNKSVPRPEEIAAATQQGLAFIPQREEFLRKYNIGYVVLHAPISGQTLSRALLEAFLGRQFITVADDGVAYLQVQ